jgi:thymidine kinase
MIAPLIKSSLEVICGPMFSGKSEELIRRLRRAHYAKLSVAVFKHQLDDRTAIDHVASHNGTLLAAQPIRSAHELEPFIFGETQVIGIDEVQFFDLEIINVICKLIARGKRVIVAGLDLDFKRRPFGPMPTLLAIADEVTKLKAICLECGTDAHFTQRLVDGAPAQYHDPVVMVGAQEQYQARCRNCHRIDLQPPF